METYDGIKHVLITNVILKRKIWNEQKIEF